MSDSSPVPASLLILAPLLGAAFVAGGITQLARLLGQDETPRARAVAALAVAAGIAALTVVALMTVTLPPDPSPALLLAAACVTGWSGPGILARLGTVIERRLGLSPSPTVFGPEPGPDEREGRGPA
ncbi:hypothetical protein [Deinococcus humi]|uniref:Peptidoglycan/LPS O-acetylase OafA/YrhL n=1 Tax=Deinococcus humi TaxID=662880 RepID=A0A7W8JQD7_9DEIO|nr:hypothetical protein [Deinococcus humi]MBB5361204.1 peptidoglycan/LPS O-acetylase OafA/YrhL [Deinococcus humi]GGO18907.1 hypothetical protein GCM10008949_02730 [Deinococcus humi]